METDDAGLDESKAVILFGRDIRKIPCFKNTMLFSTYSGLAAGLATFMFTSRVKFATNVALGSYAAVAIGYWSFCRYTYVKNKYALTELQQMMQQPQRDDGEEVKKFLQDDQEKLESA